MSEHPSPAGQRRDRARPGTSAGPDAAQLRADYRAWLHAHHPDHGGDPAAFADGLFAWRCALQRHRPADAVATLTFHRSRRRTPWNWWIERRAARARPPRVR